jgi:4Fe-4S ferredoxin
MPDHILSGIKAIVAMKLKRKGMLQREIAEYLKMDRSVVSHYIHGRYPSEKVIRVSEEIVNLPVNHGIKIINSLSDDKELTKRIIESIFNYPKIEIDKNKCILCGECLECKYNAVFRDSKNMPSVDNTKCVLCGECLNICSVNAITILTKELEE